MAASEMGRGRPPTRAASAAAWGSGWREPSTESTARWASALPVPSAIPCATMPPRPDIMPPPCCGIAGGGAPAHTEEKEEGEGGRRGCRPPQATANSRTARRRQAPGGGGSGHPGDSRGSLPALAGASPPISAALSLTLVRHGGRRGLLGGPVGLGVLLARRGAGGGPRGCSRGQVRRLASLSEAGRGVWRPQRAHAFAPLT